MAWFPCNNSNLGGMKPEDLRWVIATEVSQFSSIIGNYYALIYVYSSYQSDYGLTGCEVIDKKVRSLGVYIYNMCIVQATDTTIISNSTTMFAYCDLDK